MKCHWIVSFLFVDSELFLFLLKESVTFNLNPYGFVYVNVTHEFVTKILFEANILGPFKLAS